MAVEYTLQLLHASDFEGGLDAVQDAPRFAAIVDKLEDTHANSITVSSGDNWISGPFYSAGGDPTLSPVLDGGATPLTQSAAGAGRPDAEILNRIGLEISNFGNHEYDLGTNELNNVFSPNAGQDWRGAQFAVVQSNIDYLPGDALTGRETVGLQEASAIKGRIAPSAIITEGGQKVGFVGLTTPTINAIASPGPNVGIFPAPGSTDLDAIAAHLQPTINALVAAGANKIVLLSHMQQYTFELDLAPRLQHVDIILAGGSNAIFADSTDTLRVGDVKSENYPVIRHSNADGRPVAIVNTDGNYQYVGRLVAGFDGDGVLDVASIDSSVSGVFATTEAIVAGLWGGSDPYASGTRGGAVKQIADAVGAVINAKDGNLFGQSDVFLEGRRGFVRTEETNLGNLTADANLFRLRQIDSAVNVSIKNGGGIRDSIGVLDAESGAKLSTASNLGAGKSAGDISQLDVENSLRFNNELSLVTLTAQGLKRILEHGVAASGPGQTPGQFSQVGGIAFSFDVSRPAQTLQGNPGTSTATVTQEGQRIRSLVLKDELGNTLDVVVANGQIVGDPNRTFRIATLRFLIDDADNDGRGGDNYPFRTFGTNIVNTGVFEQTALAEFLTAKYPVAGGTPFAVADTPVALDQRIQNLAVRSDSVINPLRMADLGTSPTLAGAEISAYDSSSRRLFVTSNAGLQILDFHNPSSPVLLSTLDFTTAGLGGFSSTDVTSVAASGGLVAATLPNANKDQPGNVVFINAATGAYLGSTTVGFLPDSLHFTPDGSRILVANEGEPLPPNAAVNPEGSVSVITVNRATPSASTVQNVTFTGSLFNADRLRQQGVRITAGLTAAQDFEPEYISIAPDGVTAFVTLQENNAVATLHVPTATFTDVKALGLKDWSTGLPVLTNYQFDLAALPTIGTTTGNQNILLGGFSGLFFEGVDSATGNLKFITHTDRGPNGEPTDLLPAIPGNERPFALPAFQPRLVRFQLSRATGKIEITEQLLLTTFDGVTPLTGLPNLQSGAQGTPHTDEVPIDLFGAQLQNDPLGADLEGIAVGADGSFWMGDEYRPAIYHFSPTGQLLERFIPEGTHAAAGQPVPAAGTAGIFGTEALPAVYGERRRANRGFEAVALDPQANKLYAFIQTTLDNPNTSTPNVRNNGNVRIAEFDIASKTVTAEHVYVMRDTTAADTARTDKIGDAVWVGQGRILVAERDDRTGIDSNKLIYEIDLTGATNTRLLPNLLTSPATVTGQTIEQLDASELVVAGIQPVNKRLVVNAATLGYTRVSKLEGLAIVDANTIAVINDNDFGIEAAPIPGNGSALLRANPEPIQLGVIDFTQSNQLDPSDQDGSGGSPAIRFNNWPVFGMYMPDGIATFKVGSETFYITANEGDDRNDFINPDETRRIGAGATVLDPTKFPDATTLKQAANLGRLDYSTLNGNLDGDGDFDQLWVYGGRSFTVWDSLGNRVYDSGDSLERITARLVGLPGFNGNDGRSDNKGPEPESVTTGVIGNRTYAFIGLERTNGVIAFDVTNPRQPEFVQYIASQGDAAPEGLLFISANDSPSGRPLLVVSNETSSNIRTYELSSSEGLVINEFVFNHTGTDTNEYVELLGAPSTDYSAYTLLAIEGDAAGAGTIDGIFPLGTSDAAGYLLIDPAGNDAFENGTQTLLLVKDFNTTQFPLGTDLDSISAIAGQASDGTLDAAPWTTIADSIAVSDEAVSSRTYSPVVLGISFSGGSFAVGGASRIPNGRDTNSVADWMRNDFDGFGIFGFLGSAQYGEAANTPASVNVPVLAISTIQGASHSSPFVAQVVDTVGVVTAVRTNGFYLQSSVPSDDDVATSEGIFVFTGSAPTYSVGTLARVRGTVTEFRPGNTANNLTITQIASSSVLALFGPVAVPGPTTIGQGGRMPPTSLIEDDNFSSFDPATDGLDFYESLEGMIVQINNAVAVGPTVTFGSGTSLNREIAVLADNGADATGRTPRGGIVRSASDVNPERIFLSDALRLGDNGGDPALPAMNVGDRLNAAFVGVVDYNFGNYLVLNTQVALPTVTAANVPLETTNLVATLDHLTVATFNVENLDANDPQAKVDSLAAIVVNNLRSPDILSVEEIQDNNGPTNDAVVAANQTFEKLIQAIIAQGGPTYSFRQIDPVDDQEGGEPGGNIRVGFLFRVDRVTFVDRPGGDATTGVAVTAGAGGPALTVSPGRIDPTNPAFNSSRKPVVGEFLFNGNKLFVVANHWNSKSGDGPEFGAIQPPFLSSEAQRRGQAEAVKTFVQSVLALDASAKVIVMGDLNDFSESQPIGILRSAGLTPLIDSLPANERYTYVFDGHSQVLDHIVVSESLRTQASAQVDVVHVNSEYLAANRASDHDPVVARFVIPAPSNFAIRSAAENVRFATFNASLNRSAEGQLRDDLSHPNNPATSAQALRVWQAKNVAEVIQRVRPDVVLINEFDFDPQAADLFRDNFLEVSQNGALPIEYPFLYIAPSNTGIASGFDLNNNGQIVTTPGAAGYGDDAFGFGAFPGQFGMLLLSKYEIISDEVRTFQNFLWKDMPGARLPDNTATPAPADWYSSDELAAFRLSSKSHWDVPIRVGQEIIHVLTSHPTPPVFDGPEDRNGKRNADEIRLWADYVTPGAANYIYDDEGTIGGLKSGAKFVIMGDQNSDPRDGDSIPGAIQQVTNNPRVNTSLTPTSAGAPQAAARQGGANNTHQNPSIFDTADFADSAPGNLRADYVLPSRNLRMLDAQVFWPQVEDPLFRLVGEFSPALSPVGGFPTSDHRLVWVDVAAASVRTTLSDPELLGHTKFATGTQFEGTQIGGLSGLTFDPVTGLYYAISDDRSQFGPARYYKLEVDFGDGQLDDGDVTFVEVTTLTRPDGTPFPALGVDPEGIALTASGNLFIASEGDVNASPQINPFLSQFTLGGEQLNSLNVPTYYLPTSGDVGIRNNLAFESLTISPDGRYLFAALENGLKQDGPAATLDDESPVRILKYDLFTGQVAGEFVYFTDPVADEPNPPGGFATNGLVDLLALDNNGTFLALERSFSTGVGNSVKLYQVFTQGALDVQGLPTIADSGSTFDIDPAVRKELLYDFGEAGITIDNLEGLALGPKLADGRQSLLVVSDNNFSTTQFTQFIALALRVHQLPLVDPVVETPRTIDDEDLPTADELAGDADDPAIWVSPTDPAKSRVIGTLKDGGLVVFDLAGKVVQKVQPSVFGDPRYNNVDLVYGFELSQGGTTQFVDLAIVSDRANDSLAIYKIDPTTGLLADITAGALAAPEFSIFGVDDGEATAYGLTAYTSPISGESYVFVSQADGNRVAQLELRSLGNGRVTAQKVRELQVPLPPTGELEDAQVEGMVADRELGWLYVGQEGYGIYKFHAEPAAPTTGQLIHSVAGGILQPDLEGLTIYYAAAGTGYLLASSQGDSTYAVFAREGNNAYLGSFGIGDTNTIDQANESDGADVINVPLGPNFPFGVLIVQDGANDSQVAVIDDEELENSSTNFKFIPWEHVATALPILKLDTSSYDPRHPTPRSLVNGVAAGDVTANSVVLWTRSTQPGEVEFEVATDDNFSNVVKSETATVTNPHLPVKKLVTGLQAGTQYFYRATDAAGAAVTGKFRTASDAFTYGGLNFGVSGDWRGDLAPFPAVRNAATANLDFFVALGDTIYADVPSPDLATPQALTLQQYLIKNAEVYGGRNGLNALADLRRSTVIFATIDDHEVTNDFAGGAPIGSDPRFTGNPAELINDSELFTNGLTAFQAYNPLADETYGETGDARTAGESKLYRSRNFGLDAATFVLDTRSFRDVGLVAANPLDPTSVGGFLAQSATAERTMLGAQQLADLKADLQAAEEAGVTWKFIFVPEPMQNLGVVGASDRFEGYTRERNDILRFIHTEDIDNVIFVAADIHGTVVNNLTYQDSAGGPQIATSAFEITTGAVAYDAPFGATVADLAFGLGLPGALSPSVYQALAPAAREAYITALINGQVTALGYDPVGLDQNLPQASGLIDATLVQGGYTATNTYGWTDFQIDPQSQELRIVTYGIDAYTAAELAGDADAILTLQPQVVSEFVVRPSMTQTGQLINGTWVITGDETDNTITITETTPGNGGNYVVEFENGETRQIPKQQVEHIKVYGLEGNDTIIARDLSIAAWLVGGTGDDNLVAGRYSNLLLGGQGDDVLVAGGGGDVLIGGMGEDLLLGEEGSDLLVGGSLSYPDNADNFLALILGGWSGPGSYHDRVQSVSILLNATTVMDDAEQDILLGDQGRDWFWAGEGDLTPDSINETVTVNEDGQTPIRTPMGVLGEAAIGRVGELRIVELATPSHGAMALHADGTFTYRPGSDFSGADTFVYGIAVGGEMLRLSTVAVQVLPVNDPPIFVQGPDQTVADDHGRTVVANWAARIAAGPANEHRQGLEISVSTDRPDLFAVLPTVDASGHLMYTPAPNAKGLATVTVHLKDTGGTERGGSNASERHSFTIAIDKPFERHNSIHGLDVNDDRNITARDGLQIINYLNSIPRASAGKMPPPAGYFDTSKDNQITAQDVLLVINHLNAFGGGSYPAEAKVDEVFAAEGEASFASLDRPTSFASADLMALLAEDVTMVTKARRKGA